MSIYNICFYGEMSKDTIPQAVALMSIAEMLNGDNLHEMSDPVF